MSAEDWEGQYFDMLKRFEEEKKRTEDLQGKLVSK
jgi:hypothetical protein